jgi:hypothetical protein
VAHHGQPAGVDLVLGAAAPGQEVEGGQQFDFTTAEGALLIAA